MCIRMWLEVGHACEPRQSATGRALALDWRVWVRGVRGDISAFVQKVVFKLHPPSAFVYPKRGIKKHKAFLINIETEYNTKPWSFLTFYFELRIGWFEPCIHSLSYVHLHVFISWRFIPHILTELVSSRLYFLRMTVA